MGLWSTFKKFFGLVPHIPLGELPQPRTSQPSHLGNPSVPTGSSESSHTPLPTKDNVVSLTDRRLRNAKREFRTERKVSRSTGRSRRS
jgi:hypothetical protein